MTRRDLKVALRAYEMTREEMDAFLTSTPPRFASMATLRRAGGPIIDGVGYEWDGECAWVSLRDTRAMLKRLRRDRRICLHVMNTEYPVRWVRLEGEGEFVDDPGYERTLRIMHRYMDKTSQTQAIEDFDMEQFDRAYVEFGRTMVKLRPDYVHSHDARKQAALFELRTGRLLSPDPAAG